MHRVCFREDRIALIGEILCVKPLFLLSVYFLFAKGFRLGISQKKCVGYHLALRPGGLIFWGLMIMHRNSYIPIVRFFIH